MTQLRSDYEKFAELNTVILAIGPDGPRAYRKFWEEQRIPYIGLPDPMSKVTGIYQQEVNLMKLGRMPAMFIIDSKGIIQYSHYGSSMQDIPENETILTRLREVINRGKLI